jgi:hypothetical protein
MHRRPQWLYGGLIGMVDCSKQPLRSRKCSKSYGDHVIAPKIAPAFPAHLENIFATAELVPIIER